MKILLRSIFLITLAFLSASSIAKETDSINPETSSENYGYETLIYERVIDGDTFVASGRKIRMWGIDAPEKKHEMYAISKKGLELFLEKGRLTCKLIDVDRYQRDVMHCLSNHADIGAIMVKIGFAKAYKKYSGEFYAPEQRFAKEGKLGIWEMK